jgi:hypothetical protein
MKINGSYSTLAQMDAGGDALRQRLQGGKRLRPWGELPDSVKRKWREYATHVLEAAANAKES